MYRTIPKPPIQENDVFKIEYQDKKPQTFQCYDVRFSIADAGFLWAKMRGKNKAGKIFVVRYVLSREKWEWLVQTRPLPKPI